MKSQVSECNKGDYDYNSVIIFLHNDYFSLWEILSIKMVVKLIEFVILTMIRSLMSCQVIRFILFNIVTRLLQTLDNRD